MIYGMNTGAAEKLKPRCKRLISGQPTSYIYYRPYYGPETCLSYAAAGYYAAP